jgi:hypothetical protein
MKHIIIALSVAATLFATGASSAQESTEYAGNHYFASTQTRAEVKAETRLAIQRGQISTGERYGDIAEAVTSSSKTRAEVKAELVEYRKTHPEVSDDIAAF